MRVNEAWLGFKIIYVIDPKLSDPEQETVDRAFITEAIEKNGLVYHGGGRTHVQGFANAEYPASATEPQRQAVTEWLAGNPGVVEFEVGPLQVETEDG